MAPPHGHFDLARLAPRVEDAGSTITERGPVAFPLRRFDNLLHALATA